MINFVGDLLQVGAFLRLNTINPIPNPVYTQEITFSEQLCITWISDRGTPYQTFMILDSVVYTLATAVIQAVDEDSR